MKKYTLERLEDLRNKLKEPGIGKTVLLFSASLDSDKLSWCPDCRKADPVIDKCLTDCESELGDDFSFITVFTGQREEWKTPENEFRKAPEFNVDCVPTLLSPLKVTRN